MVVETKHPKQKGDDYDNWRKNGKGGTMKTFAITICFVLLVVAPCAKNEKSKDEKAKPYLVEDHQNYSRERQIRIENENTEDQIEQLELRMRMFSQGPNSMKQWESGNRIENLERRLRSLEITQGNIGELEESLALVKSRVLLLEMRINNKFGHTWGL